MYFKYPAAKENVIHFLKNLGAIIQSHSSTEFYQKLRGNFTKSMFYSSIKKLVTYYQKWNNVVFKMLKKIQGYTY